MNQYRSQQKITKNAIYGAMLNTVNNKNTFRLNFSDKFIRPIGKHEYLTSENLMYVERMDKIRYGIGEPIPFDLVDDYDDEEFELDFYPPIDIKSSTSIGDMNPEIVYLRRSLSSKQLEELEKWLNLSSEFMIRYLTGDISLEMNHTST